MITNKQDSPKYWEDLKHYGDTREEQPPEYWEELLTVYPKNTVPEYWEDM